MALVGNWIPRGNDSQRLGGQLAALIAQLSAAAATAASLSNVMSQMAPSGDYTTIESTFGLQPGQGQTLHDVVGTVSTDLSGGNIQGLLQRFG